MGTNNVKKSLKNRVADGFFYAAARRLRSGCDTCCLEVADPYCIAVHPDRVEGWFQCPGINCRAEWWTARPRL